MFSMVSKLDCLCWLVSWMVSELDWSRESVRDRSVADGRRAYSMVRNRCGRSYTIKHFDLDTLEGND